MEETKLWTKEFEQEVISELPTVTRWCCSKGVDFEISEDITQEVALIAFNDFKKFNGSSKVSTWLIGIAKNKIRHWRHVNRIEMASLEFAITLKVEQEDLYDKELVNKAFEDGIAKLPSRQRNFLRDFWDGDRQAVIADNYGVVEKYVKSQIHRAKKSLRKYIEEQINDPVPIKLDNVVRITWYIKSLREKFRYTEHLFYRELKLKELCKKIGLKNQLAWIVNGYLLKVDKHRVWSLINRNIDPNDIYEEFKEWDRRYHKDWLKKIRADEDISKKVSKQRSENRIKRINKMTPEEFDSMMKKRKESKKKYNARQKEIRHQNKINKLQNGTNRNN